MDNEINRLIQDNRKTLDALENMMKKNAPINISDSIAFLKKYRKPIGTFSKCKSFLPLGVYIEGWLLPTNLYDVIEVYADSRLVGYAKTGIERK